jgi:NAD(P)-dependent dehydrogenase (short-subunit alcohol dehydrogenase family)
VDLAGAVPLRLDITDPASVTAAAAIATDVSLLVNNAGISLYQDLVTGDLDKIRREMDTGFFGTLAVIRAFAPVLAANGGGAILNVLSRMSWLSYPGANSYAAAKAAAWSLTNGARLELAGQGTLVTGLLMSATDTDMMAGWDIPKNDPADVVRQALAGLEAGDLEVVADADTAAAKAGLSGDPRALYGALLTPAGR